jgi:toxin ParE1/3/4
MSRRINRHELAKRDLAEHAEYIRRDNPRAALRFLEASEKAFELLAAMPAMGGLEEDMRPELAGLRCWPIHGFGKYLVFYLPFEDGIEVIRVLHGSRDIKAILGK